MSASTTTVTTTVVTTTNDGSDTSTSGTVKIYGMSVSANVIPSAVLAMDTGCGEFVYKNIMGESEMKTDEMLAINPWHQIPSMSDGELGLGESGAILRYIANKYAPELYGSDAESKAVVDWALDWASTNFYKSFAALWYPVAGFGAPPESYPAECEKALANLAKFEAKFLGGKFIGGDSLTIADYKVATLMWYLDFPAVKAITGFELPARSKAYVADFIASSKSWAAFCGGDGPWDPTGFMVSKETAPAPAASAAPAVPDVPEHDWQIRTMDMYLTYDNDKALGKPAPALDSVEYFQGEPVALGGGKLTVVMFFGKFAKGDYTTIDGCGKMSQIFPTVQFVGVALDPKKEDAEKFLTKIGTEMKENNIKKMTCPFPLAWDAGKTAKTAYSELGLVAPSSIYVVGGDGNVVWREQFGQGYSPPKKGQLREQLYQLVTGGALVKNGQPPVVSDDEEEMDLGGADDYDSDLGF